MSEPRSTARAAIETELAEDARKHPAFAMARKSAVLAGAEAHPQTVVDGITTWATCARLRRYEACRGGQKTVSAKGLAFAQENLSAVEVSAYERARHLSLPTYPKRLRVEPEQAPVAVEPPVSTLPPHGLKGAMVTVAAVINRNHPIANALIVFEKELTESAWTNEITTSERIKLAEMLVAISQRLSTDPHRERLAVIAKQCNRNIGLSDATMAQLRAIQVGPSITAPPPADMHKLRSVMKTVYAANTVRSNGSDAGGLLTELEGSFSTRALNALDDVGFEEAIRLLVAIHALGLPDLAQAKRMRALCRRAEAVPHTAKADRWLADVIHSLSFWKGLES